MDHTSERCNKPDRLSNLALGVYNVVTYVRRSVTFRLITHGNHVLGDGVEFGVSSVSHTLHLAVEVPRPIGLQGFGVHGIRHAVFFASQEEAIVIDNVGIGSCSDLQLHSIGILVAVFARESASSCSFFLKLFSVDISLFEVDVASFDAKSADNAIPVDPLREKKRCYVSQGKGEQAIFTGIERACRVMAPKTRASSTYHIVGNVRREGRVGVDAIERPIELLGNFTINDKAVDVRLQAVGSQKLRVDWLLRPGLRIGVGDCIVAGHACDVGLFTGNRSSLNARVLTTSCEDSKIRVEKFPLLSYKASP